jgi:hypothetical protein
MRRRSSPEAGRRALGYRPLRPPPVIMHPRCDSSWTIGKPQRRRRHMRAGSPHAGLIVDFSQADRTRQLGGQTLFDDQTRAPLRSARSENLRRSWRPALRQRRGNQTKGKPTEVSSIAVLDCHLTSPSRSAKKRLARSWKCLLLKKCPIVASLQLLRCQMRGTCEDGLIRAGAPAIVRA